jgi:hypothetical protein
MNAKPQTQSPSGLLPSSRRLLAWPPLDWLIFFFDLFRSLHQVITQRAHEGMYEILDYDATLELVDPTGETAIFKRHQRVKFLQDNVIAFQDYAWGEGEIFAAYHCAPGQVVDRYQEGDQWNVLISLRETKSAGDVETFYTKRTITGGFTQAEEWWQIQLRHRTQRCQVAIMFPQQRRCQRAVLIEKTRNRTTVLPPTHFARLTDGRQVLTWQAQKPRRFETYTLKWQW